MSFFEWDKSFQHNPVEIPSFTEIMNKQFTFIEKGIENQFLNIPDFYGVLAKNRLFLITEKKYKEPQKLQ